MGVGNKPFLDIQPSDAAISDRAVHYIMKSRGNPFTIKVHHADDVDRVVTDLSWWIDNDRCSGARTRASIAVSVFDHSNPFNGGVVTSDLSASGASSSGLLGPLNLHMYRYDTHTHTLTHTSSNRLSPPPAVRTSPPLLLLKAPSSPPALRRRSRRPAASPP